VYILTYIDVASRWPEAMPLRTTTAKAVLCAIFNIFARNRYLRVLVMECCPQFVGIVMRHFCKKVTIEKVKSVPYRFQSNGFVEHLHGTLFPIVQIYVVLRGIGQSFCH